jgi:hypothetical protein
MSATVQRLPCMLGFGATLAMAVSFAKAIAAAASCDLRSLFGLGVLQAAAGQQPWLHLLPSGHGLLINCAASFAFTVSTHAMICVRAL